MYMVENNTVYDAEFRGIARENHINLFFNLKFLSIKNFLYLFLIDF